MSLLQLPSLQSLTVSVRHSSFKLKLPASFDCCECNLLECDAAEGAIELNFSSGSRQVQKYVITSGPTVTSCGIPVELSVELQYNFLWNSIQDALYVLRP